MWKYLVFLLLVCNYIESVTNQACPRAPMIRDGICATRCVPSTGCTEPNSDCLCDSQCGFSCVKRGLSCGSAPTTRNADLTSSGTQFNDTVVYTCQPGYTINGDNVRRCTAKGKWSGVGPTCLRVCKQPDLPFGAYVKTNVKSEYKTGESIMLDCKKGFKKIGKPRRICISGRWTAFPFECKATHSCTRTIRASRTRCTAKCSPNDPAGCPAGHNCLCDGQCGYSCVEQGLQCLPPRPVKNGIISFNSSGYNDTVTYRCQEGFTLNGDTVRRCTAKKRWGGAVPSCLPDCGLPRVPKHAYIENNRSKYASGDRVTFKCVAGYNQEGIATTLCFMGKWNVMPFRCDKGGCGDPGTPENGNKVGISYAPGREVFFSCNIGYVRNGSEQRRCLPNNTWSGQQPTCELIDCGPPKKLKNGTIIGSETTFRKSISFRCDDGFELDGSDTNAICQSDGKWSTTPECKPVDCASLDVPLHGSKTGNETTYTNKIIFSCDPGYKLSGSAVRYCPSSGIWDGVQPTCNALNCGVLKAPLNGSIQGDKWTYPNSVRFGCDKGFDLIGPSVRACQTDGTWGGQPVRCQAVDCRKLERPQNGSLTGSQTTYPATIEFQCDEGFLLKGSKKRTCQANRTWSGMLTFCNAVNCGKPAFVDDGVISGKDITYPNVITIECEEGYLLNGPKSRKCQANGTWSGRHPTCDAISCGVLNAPINGSKIGNVYTYPNDVTFSCDQGFDLIGSRSRVCLSDGSWSGQDTFCKAVDCGPLAVPMNGSLKGSLTIFPNEITFGCDRGFRMKGSARRRCQTNRRWSGSLTTCEAVDCGPLNQPMNGSIFGSATVFPNKMAFSCVVGFLLRGSQQRECQADGKWSGETTRCEAVDCGSLAVPMNGSLRGQLTVFPNKIKFSCDVGFDLIGSTMRTCQSNGSWSGTMTKCKAKYCGLLPRPRNGSSSGVLLVYPNKMKFKCDEGFDLRGSRIRKCLANGSWSGVTTSCHAVDCGPLRKLKKGSSVGLLTTFPNKITFTCERGSRMTGSSIRECQANRTWSGTMPTCKAVDCGYLPTPKNGSKRGDLTYFPNRVIFYCDKGSKLRGSKIRTCLENGSWSGRTTYCQAVDCGSLAVPTNGSMVGKKTVYPNIVKFSCDKGFVLRGSPVRKCLHFKMWSGYTAYCEAIDCGLLSIPVNGTIRGNLTVYPNTIKFICHRGFNLIGSKERECLANGNWSGTKSSCKAKDCGPLFAPMNGTMMGKKTVFPNIIRFKCDEGFYLIGSPIRKCLASGKWNGMKPKCRAVDCGVPPLPTNGSMYGNKTVFPNTIRFSCDEGFDLIGSASRKCMSDGKWSGSMTSCKAVDCGSLDVPQNGSKHGSLTVFPNTIKFSCDEGFLLRGSSSRVCQANRTWSGSLTRCEAIDCGPFPVPRNGSISGTKTVFPNTLKLNCDEGFDLIGSSLRTCLSNGKWSGNKTFCRAVDCGPLAVPRNGSKHGSLTVFPNTIKFSCDEGFLLRGSSSRVCQANRTWSGSLTRCEAVDCGVLVPPTNGTMYGSLTVFPNSITFTCDKGFDLIGSPLRTCTSNRKWDGVHPTCKAVDCGPLTVPQNGSKHGSLTVFPNTITFSCDEGFLLRGSSSRVCQANRTWSGSLTRCGAIDCGSLSLPMNGSMYGNSTVFPNNITFKCNEGHDLIGSSVRTCLSNGKWDGKTTTCRAVDCGPLVVPQNGSKHGSLTVFPNTIKFSCDEGFLLRGSSSRVCQANRTWSGSLTRCEAIDCDPLSVPMNGTMRGTKTVFPNIMTFSCDEGFDVLGSSKRTCLSNGNWSGTQPTCQAVDCGPLVVPQNGSKHGSLTVFPNTIKFSCDEGFLLRGSSSRVCQANRTWSGSLTRCEAVDCGALDAPQNGSLQGALTVFPNTIKFSCDEGFLLRGSSSRVCQANRTWSGSLTRCEAVNCGQLAIPMNGSMYGNKTVFPNSIKFRCDEGFDMMGSSLRSCLSNGKWSGDPTICKAVDCSTLVAPQNGSLQGALTVFPSMITLSCDEGFLLRGSSSRVCQANRTWSGSLTRCEAIDCGSLSVPMNGSMYGSSTVFPNSITFKCDKGFDLIGSSVRTCLSNGKWDGNRTTCRAVDCGPLDVPQNGSKHGSLTVFPNTIKFSCDEGFLLRGSSSRVCQANRTWSGSLTRCEAINCGPLGAPINGSVFGNKTVFPNILKFSCDKGFDLIGSSRRACLSHGNWSGTMTACRAVDCGPLHVPQNGSKHGSLTVFPNRIKFSCDEGFLLRGSLSRVCQANRTWSGSLTRCEAKDCGFIPAPMNGSIFGNQTIFPNSKTLQCDEGFDLIGPSLRTCLSNGNWSGTQPSCKAVDCGSLAVPQNGSKHGSLTVFRNTIKFSCDEGFLLRGSSSRVCQANRTWSGSLTRCEALDCGPLSAPVNGSFYGNRTFFPNKIKFECDVGFDLLGSSERTCLFSGMWSGNITSCKAVDCGSLAVPQNGSKYGSSTVFPNVVSFNCDEGFLLRGSSSRVCQANRTWSGILTQCEAVDCGSLVVPVNGSMYGNITTFPHSLRFDCDEGFDLLGSSVRTCLSSGKWNGNMTTCRAVDCGPLAVPQNGSKHGSLTVFPNTIKFSCDEGFLLRGSSSRVCQANRTWSGILTRCEAIDCGPLSVPMNGTMQGTKTVFPNFMTFSCDEGFDLLGSSKRTCLSNGNWSGTQPTCQAVNCGPLAVPQNGSKHGSLTVFPNTIKFSCDEGFLLRGSSSRVCQANRTWSGSLTRCEAIDCGPLTVPMNGSLFGNKTFFPNIIAFSCDEGFDIIGSTERKCLSNGKWSGSITTCKAVDCGRLATPLNGSLFGSSTVFPNKISFQCDEGFLRRGPSVRVCQSNRTWSGEETKCQAIDCGSLDTPTNGSLHGELTVFPNKMRFTCDEGFNLLGSPMRTCLSNGTWSGSRVSCKAVDCGYLAVPVNGSSSGSLTTYPNKNSFTCDKGFILIGSSVRTCLSNRTWNGTTTRCQAVECGPLVVPMNGTSKGSLTVFPNVITFRCDRGFILSGSSSRQCQASGTWSGAKTVCKVINCGSLLEPRNGFACGERTVFSHAIKFHCDTGFVLIGSPVRRCQANGVWSGTTTYCRAVDCGFLEAPMNGTKKGMQTVFPNVVQFGCDKGFILQGSSDRICQVNGTWSGVPARCNAVDCGSLAVPMNGSLQGQITVFPNKINLNCDVGFDLIGSSVRSCQSSGLWSGSLTVCQAVDCGSLNVPKNGRVAALGTTYTQRAVFTCYDGFILKGNSVRVCQANRTWNGKQPHCDAVDCGKLEPPTNGAMRGQLTVFPNKVTFTCYNGFDLIGSPEAQCLASGLWSNNTPSCKAVRCKQPVIPPNSYLTTRLQPYFDNEKVIYFSCKPGFFLRGTPILTCLNGNWTKTEFLCLPPKCNPPHVPDNAYITFPRGKKGPYVENDEVYFSCNNGYYLTGKPSIFCKGQWTTYQFTCHPVECGPLPPPKRGSIVRSTGTTFGQQYEFGCDWENGFKLDGSQIRKCQANKQWDGTQPFCHLLSCGEPKTPEHGMKLDFNYTYNNIVRFRCDRGYAPRGYRETRCQINSRWTGTGLTCLSCSAPLGIESRKIPIKILSASSERDPSHSADHGRLFDSSAWCSARSAYAKYLQVDFGSMIEVTAIATQGHPEEYKWVHKYHLKYALGAHWFEYRVNGEIKVFRGNRDRNTVVKRYLEKSIIAHKLRLYRYENTNSFSGSSVCLRMEVYGCTFYTKCLTVGTKVLARWYRWQKQTTYIMGYVSEINEKVIGIIPHDKHSSLTPGTVLTVSRSDPYYILKDAVPEEREITNRVPVVMILRGQDGAAVYPSGKVVNKIGVWYQVNLDNDEIAHWRKLSQIRLMHMPDSCETHKNNKLEIKK